MEEKTKEEKKRLGKEKLEKFLHRCKESLRKASFSLVLVALAALLIYSLTWMYQDARRTAVEVPHQGTVVKSETIFVPPYYDGKTEHPAKVVNYLEVECNVDSATFRLTPAYLNEFIQEGDTVIVYTYHSKIYDLKSDITRYRWDGELYE
jgi:hypothetical protein